MLRHTDNNITFYELEKFESKNDTKINFTSEFENLSSSSTVDIYLSLLRSDAVSIRKNSTDVFEASQYFSMPLTIQQSTRHIIAEDVNLSPAF